MNTPILNQSLRVQTLKPWTLIFLVLLAVLVVNVAAGCAAGANQLQGTTDRDQVVAGFRLGLWHGFIAPVMFVVSLFKSTLGIYEAHNNGGWYNFGYLFGLACFFGCGGHQTARRRVGQG